MKVTRNDAQYPLHHVTYLGTKFKVAMPNGLGDVFTRKCTFDLDLGVKVTRNVVQYPLHHVTYLGIKFKAAMSKGLGGYAFTRKYII